MNALAEHAREMLIYEGGFTLSLDGKTPLLGYFVALDNEAKFPNAPPTVEQIEWYIGLSRNLDRSGYYLGGWYNVKDDSYYLDETIVFDVLSEALDCARMHGQKAVYDAYNQCEIWL